MITLCMDTSSAFLALCLIKEHAVVAKYQKRCWKQQSEEIFPALLELLQKVDLSPDAIDQVVVSKGPGSYTGVRIAMTVAKVFCAMGDKPLATVSTLQLYAGVLEHARIVLDARGQRAYTAYYEHGVCVEEETVLPLEIIAEKLQEQVTVVGDGHLVDRPDYIPDLAANFLALEKQWRFAANVHMVSPTYLKSSESYRTGIQ